MTWLLAMLVPNPLSTSLATLLTVFALFPHCALATLSPISVKGSKFFSSDGAQFFMKGIQYVRPVDGLLELNDASQCAFDAPVIQKLGANVIRVSYAQPGDNHDACMKAFDDAGIYVMVDLDGGEGSPIDDESPDWNVYKRDRWSQILDTFQKYDNLLGFFAGFDTFDQTNTTNAAEYVKAAITDMKAYRDFMQYRKIPIGYVAYDIAELRTLQQDYFDCGNDSISADFYGINTEYWCYTDEFAGSDYEEMYNQAEGYDIPIILTGTGCSDVTPRDFSDQAALLGTDMNDRFSGSLVYEWANAEGYKFVTYNNLQATGEPTRLRDFDELSTQWATLKPTGIRQSDYSPTLTKRKCPDPTESLWDLPDVAALPVVGTSGLTRPESSATTGSVDVAATQGVTSGPVQNKKISGGAIAGIVIGTLVAAALVMGLVIFFLRRRRQHVTELEGSQAQPVESDKMLVTENGSNKESFYSGTSHRFSAREQSSELDTSATAYELSQGHQAENYELPGTQEIVYPKPQDPEVPLQPSPYVQAQRKMEIDWLENEEARLRHQRELLRQQND
ncbi:hypothetical protein CC78DRAFT_565914 [Lojkania enalia]|uniref:1,3-beta-glucanosyltransferase n=1 Tax=Lojkania enalia TaxID=147567 RepID=A0A9P4KGH9_9PLEO|nr:hypothetical protein CC78DRAFT_565914 [Didymosphaeria enalia]